MNNCSHKQKGLLETVTFYIQLLLGLAFVLTIVAICFFYASSFKNHYDEHQKSQEKAAKYIAGFCPNKELRIQVGESYDQCAGAETIINQSSFYEAFIKSGYEFKISEGTGYRSVNVNPLSLISMMMSGVSVLSMLGIAGLIYFFGHMLTKKFESSSSLPFSNSGGYYPHANVQSNQNLQYPNPSKTYSNNKSLEHITLSGTPYSRIKLE